MRHTDIESLKRYHNSEINRLCQMYGSNKERWNAKQKQTYREHLEELILLDYASCDQYNQFIKNKGIVDKKQVQISIVKILSYLTNIPKFRVAGRKKNMAKLYITKNFDNFVHLLRDLEFEYHANGSFEIKIRDQKFEIDQDGTFKTPLKKGRKTNSYEFITCFKEKPKAPVKIDPNPIETRPSEKEYDEQEQLPFEMDDFCSDNGIFSSDEQNVDIW